MEVHSDAPEKHLKYEDVSYQNRVDRFATLSTYTDAPAHAGSLHGVCDGQQVAPVEVTKHCCDCANVNSATKSKSVAPT